MSRSFALLVALTCLGPVGVGAGTKETYRIDIDEGSDGKVDSRIYVFHDELDRPVKMTQVKGAYRRSTTFLYRRDGSLVVNISFSPAYNTRGMRQLSETTVYYDSLGRIRRVCGVLFPENDGAGPPVEQLNSEYVYDEQGRLKRRVTFAPDQSEKVISETNYSYRLDGQGRVREVTMDAGSSNMNIHRFHYDGRGRLIKETTRYRPGETAQFETTYKRDRGGKLILKTFRHGAQKLLQTSYSYDSKGRLRRIRGNLDYAGDCTSTTWHPLAKATCLSLNANQGTARIVYRAKAKTSK